MKSLKTHHLGFANNYRKELSSCVLDIANKTKIMMRGELTEHSDVISMDHRL